MLGANGPKKVPHRVCPRTEIKVAAVGKDSLVITDFFAFNLLIINNQCDLQNNLRKMIGFIIAINYSVQCHQR